MATQTRHDPHKALQCVRTKQKVLYPCFALFFWITFYIASNPIHFPNFSRQNDSAMMLFPSRKSRKGQRRPRSIDCVCIHDLVVSLACTHSYAQKATGFIIKTEKERDSRAKILFIESELIGIRIWVCIDKSGMEQSGLGLLLCIDVTFDPSH